MQGITDALKTRGETRKIWLYVEQFGASNNIKKRMGKSFQQIIIIIIIIEGKHAFIFSHLINDI